MFLSMSENELKSMIKTYQKEYCKSTSGKSKKQLRELGKKVGIDKPLRNDLYAKLSLMTRKDIIKYYKTHNIFKGKIDETATKQTLLGLVEAYTNYKKYKGKVFKDYKVRGKKLITPKFCIGNVIPLKSMKECNKKRIRLPTIERGIVKSRIPTKKDINIIEKYSFKKAKKRMKGPNSKIQREELLRYRQYISKNDIKRIL